MRAGYNRILGINFRPTPSQILGLDWGRIIKSDSETTINIILLISVPASTAPNKFLLRFFLT